MPQDQLRVLICFFITHQWEKKEEAFIINSEVRSLTPENYQVINGLRRSFRIGSKRSSSKGIAAGKFRVKNAIVAAIAVCDILGGPARWYYPKELLALEETMEMITDMIFQLLGVPPMSRKAESPRAEQPAGRPPAESGGGRSVESGSRLSAAGNLRPRRWSFRARGCGSVDAVGKPPLRDRFDRFANGRKGSSGLPLASKIIDWIVAGRSH